MFDSTVRRWCEKHSKEWDDEVASKEEFVRPCFSGERAGVPGDEQDGRGTDYTLLTDDRGDDGQGTTEGDCRRWWVEQGD